MGNSYSIVCVSINAPPMNDAEALCTIRLLSALAAHGHAVTLITGDHAPTLDSSITRELTDTRIRIVRVPLPSVTRVQWTMFQLCQGIRVPMLNWLQPAIRVTRDILAAARDPFLLTRSMPLVSNLVGYHCRRNAYLWVAHFSDPYPPVDWRQRWYSHWAIPMHRRWARRIVHAADLISVTCPNAIRYISEAIGADVLNKSIVLPHLAMPMLQPGTFRLDRYPDEFVIAHIGALMTRRRPDLLLRGALMAIDRHPQIRFLQYGHVDYQVLRHCEAGVQSGRLDVRHIANLSPRDAADLQSQVDANIIVDTDLGLSYSPFLLSKYPHAACAGRPMLMIGSADSEMARMTHCHGGGEFVPFGSPKAIADAIEHLYFQREHVGDSSFVINVRDIYSPTSVVRPFVTALADRFAGRMFHGTDGGCCP